MRRSFGHLGNAQRRRQIGRAWQVMPDRAPDLPQVGAFDTAFHATNPDVATAYALPADLRAEGIRRYGFHGLSYASMVEGFGSDLPPRLLAFHLGNGARLHRIHGSADLSPKGREQSAGIMVNYLYDLGKIEEYHEAYFDEGVISASRSVRKLLD